MSFQGAASRRRDLTNSPPPTITKGKADARGVAALLEKASPLVPRDPKRMFDLALPFRNSPRFNPSPNSMSNRGGSQPSSPRGWAACPFAKSRSMPELQSCSSLAPSAASGTPWRTPPGHIFGLDPDAEENENEEMLAVWQCKLCGSQDTSRLERGPDSQMVCPCGVVAEGVAMIGQERAGNCPREKDKTDVGDAPSAHRSQSAPPWAGGDETPEARQRRLRTVEGGTARLPTRMLQASEMLLGQTLVDNQARQDAQAICREDAPDRGRGQMLLKALATEVFTQLGKKNMHEAVQRHIRLETIRIYQASVRHHACCHKHACLFVLSQYNSKALAFGIARHVLTGLATESDAGASPAASDSASDPVTTMASLTQGTGTRHDAERHLKELQQMELASKSGRTPQMKILSAVGLISKWKHGAEQCACDDEWTYMPPTLRNPASVQNCPGEYGKPPQVDPGDRTVKLRRKLQDFADITFSTSDLRVAAAHQLDVSHIVQLMIDASLHVDVTAVGLLAATARALKKAYDPTLAVLSYVPSTYQVSASTVENYIRELAAVVELPAKEDDSLPPSLIFGN